MLPQPLAHASPKRGFALVLALAVMALLVLVTLALAGLLRVESTTALVRQASVMARLNALAALRLAQSSVQQSLGPDTRVSASARLHEDPLKSSQTVPGQDPFDYPILGVWRSWEGLNHDARPKSRYAGRPHKPDYAIKVKPYDAATPAQGRFVRWLVSMPSPGVASSDATRPPAPPAVHKQTSTLPLLAGGTSAEPTQQVYLPPLSLADGSITTVTPPQGAFAWWVGGQNQKALVSFPPSDAPTSTRARSERLATFGLPDLEALGFATPTQPLPVVPSRASLDLVALPADTSRLAKSLKEATPTPLTRAGFHDVTYLADGLLTNTATGGFRKDLSLFSETWDQMNALDATRAAPLPLFRVKPATTRRTATTQPDHDLAFLRPLPDSRFPSGGIGNRRRHALLYWWADYGSLGGNDTGLASDGGTIFGGYFQLSSFPPIRSWAYLVDYNLHYRKYVKNPDSSLGGVVEMEPPTNLVGEANSGRYYALYERINRHPLVARYQFVFAATAVGNRPTLVVQPVVTVWNPYNVKLTVPAFNTRAYPIYLPIGFEVADKTGAMATQVRPFSDWVSGGRILCQVGSGTLTFEPGQTRVFSLPPSVGSRPVYARGQAVPQQTLQPGYIASGASGILLDVGVPAADTSILTFKLLRRLSIAGGDAYRNGIYFEWLPANTEEVPVRYSFEGLTDADFQTLYGVEQDPPWESPIGSLAASPRFFATFSFGARLSNDGIAQYSARTGVRTVSKGFLQSNPFTNYTELGRKSAFEMTVYRWASSDITNGNDNLPVGTKIRYSPGFNNLNPAHFTAANPAFTYAGSLNLLNAPFDLDFKVVTGASELPQADPSTAEGFVVTGLEAANGLSRAVIAELPIRPLLSLAELQGCDLRFTNPVPPYMTNLVGNADASPILPPDDPVGKWIDQARELQPRDMHPAAHMQYDDSYCLNHLLFDDWFFSGLAPRPSDWAALRPTPGLEHAWNGAVMTSLGSAWSDFSSGTVPLGNRAYVAAPTAAAFSPDVKSNAFGGSGTTGLPVGYLRVASHLNVRGQFNVNSVSVPAWRAVLGNLRDVDVPVLPPGAATVTQVNANNPLLRMQVAPESAQSGTRSRAVLGFAALTDDQLDTLAEAIVQQVRLRGPFLSLSEFVNRKLAAADGTLTDPSLSGALGMALRELEGTLAAPAAGVGKATSGSSVFNGTGLLPRLALGDWTQSSGEYAHPRAAEGNSNFGMPGWPRQADLLRSLAPVITVRDDTVIVRAYGAASGVGGNSSAWCEAVLVRTPDYVDARIPAHEAPQGDEVVAGTVGLPNVAFGRRFRVVSFRWLAPHEL